MSGQNDRLPPGSEPATFSGCAQGRRKALQAILGRFDTDAVHQNQLPGGWTGAMTAPKQNRHLHAFRLAG